MQSAREDYSVKFSYPVIEHGVKKREYAGGRFKLFRDFSGAGAAEYAAGRGAEISPGELHLQRLIAHYAGRYLRNMPEEPEQVQFKIQQVYLGF